MATFSEKILRAFELADRINESLWLDCKDSSVISLDDLHTHIQKEFGVQIELHAVDVEAEHLFGFIERYEDGQKARIYIVKNITPRWKRAVGAKELCHAVVDEPEDFQTDGIDTIQRLAGVIVETDAPENNAWRSEQIAEMTSWELLYPHELRAKDISDMKSGITTIPKIAARYQLPEIVIEQILSPPYIATCQKYWGQIVAARRLS